ncbi:MAG: prolyl oligopeptidase family serine peptidase [Planctomycetota bacterium]
MNNKNRILTLIRGGTARGRFGSVIGVMTLAMLAILNFAQLHADDIQRLDAHDRALPEAGEHEGFAETLDTVAWTPSPFIVTTQRVWAPHETVPIRFVEFPSPRPTAHAPTNTVHARWYVAQPESPQPDQLRPAVVLVHSLHPDAPIAQALARTLAQRGVHALLIDLPGYRRRRGPDDVWPGVRAVLHGAQAVADVRRAYDAAAALPGIDPDRILLQGTSLGSFPAAVAAGLGTEPYALVLLLGGGNLIDIIEHGQKDAANFRETLERHGIHQTRRAAVLAPLEPLKIAHRLNPQTTWLLAARNDQVVSPANALALAEAIGLDASRFVYLPGNHYTATFALPAVVDLLVRIAEAEDPGTLDAP